MQRLPDDRLGQSEFDREPRRDVKFFCGLGRFERAIDGFVRLAGCDGDPRECRAADSRAQAGSSPGRKSQSPARTMASSFRSSLGLPS